MTIVVDLGQNKQNTNISASTKIAASTKFAAGTKNPASTKFAAGTKFLLAQNLLLASYVCRPRSSTLLYRDPVSSTVIEIVIDVAAGKRGVTS